jgi:hypothetical protein
MERNDLRSTALLWTSVVVSEQREEEKAFFAIKNARGDSSVIT